MGVRVFPFAQASAKNIDCVVVRRRPTGSCRPLRKRGTSTPRRFGPITAVSAYWVARSSRAMTVECAARPQSKRCNGFKFQGPAPSRSQAACAPSCGAAVFALEGVRLCRLGGCAWQIQQAGGLRSRPRKVFAAMTSGVRGLGRERGIDAARRSISPGDSGVRRSATRQLQAEPARWREFASQHIPIWIPRLKVRRSSLGCRTCRDGRYQGCRDEHFEAGHWRISVLHLCARIRAGDCCSRVAPAGVFRTRTS